MKINGNELEEILRAHQLWLEGEGGERANLSSATLIGADLSSANLSSAILIGANLSGAILSSANLSSATLRNATLRDANLGGCAGNRREIKSIFISEKYSITYTADSLRIGCRCYPIKDWWNFSDEEISGMDSGALEWWDNHKDIIKQIIDKHPAETARCDKESSQ